jgi:hypothetical protein
MSLARILILEEKPNPSTDYFVLPALKAQGHDLTQVERLAWSTPLNPEKLQDRLVVVVRYLTAQWRQSLSEHRARIGQLVYFVDDDLGDWRAAAGLPWRYRAKLYQMATRHWPWLMTHADSVWVSSQALAEKYSAHQPQVLSPTPIASPVGRCRVFYHASASHRAEIDWLHPVMQDVLAQAPRVDFEIVGDRRTHRDYRELPRTTLVHPMSWQSYQSFVALSGRDIGLAPFLPSAFNAARSYTKLFDIARAQAHGLLADNGPWVSVLQAKHPFKAGQFRMVPMEQRAWSEALLEWSEILVR